MRGVDNITHSLLLYLYYFIHSHSFIYNVLSNDNEKKSAECFDVFAKDTPLQVLYAVNSITTGLSFHSRVSFTMFHFIGKQYWLCPWNDNSYRIAQNSIPFFW